MLSLSADCSHKHYTSVKIQTPGGYCGKTSSFLHSRTLMLGCLQLYNRFCCKSVKILTWFRFSEVREAQWVGRAA